MSNNSPDRVARRLARLEAAINRGRANQLKNSSFEGGGITQYSPDGSQVLSRFGEQYDGTGGLANLAGPMPPTPAQLYAEPAPGGVLVRWNGDWEPAVVDDRPVVAPLDFAHVEIHASVDPAFTGLLFATKRGEIISARGGEIVLNVQPGVGIYLRAVVRTNAGKTSVPSAVVGPIYSGKLASEAVDVDWEEIGGNRIWRQESAPTGEHRVGDLWLEIPENIAYRWESDPADPTDANVWTEVRDQGVVQALQDAFQANETAVQAGLDALAAQGAAQAAQGAAEGAQGTAQDASESAAAALAEAAAAQAAALAAHQAADAAQDAADTADAAALSAAGIAASKGRVYYQDSPPTPGDPNGLWVDTNDSNKPYRWDAGLSIWTLVRDAGIQAAASAADAANDAAVAAAAVAASKVMVFAQISAPSTTGRTLGDIWIDTDDGNKRYIWNGAWTASVLGAPAISATARELGAITTFRQASAPASGMLVGDFWIDSDDNKLYRWEGSTPSWVAVQDVAIQAAITSAATAQSTADGKMRIFPQPSAPTGLVAGDLGDMWIDTDDGNKSYTWSGTAWDARLIGNSAIQPQSLVASNVIATGTITAALLQSVLVLASTIVAGNPTGTHARMTSTGFRVFREDLIDGIADEVIRMGTDTNDFLGISDGSNKLIGSWDDTGRISVTGATVNGPLILRGRDVESMFTAIPGGGGAGTGIPGAQNTIGWDGNAPINAVTTEIGLLEVAVTVDANRLYMLIPSFYFEAGNASTYVQLTVRDGGTGTPSINSPIIMRDYFSSGNNGSWTILAQRIRGYKFATSGVHRLLLTAAGGAGSINVRSIEGDAPTILVIDAGPFRGNPASMNRGGGSTAPPVQQYFTELAPAGWATFNGSGAQRSDTAEVIQGYDPSGFNGDGYGYWWFNKPNITGTVDRVEFYAYSNHWYYNSGGTARLRAVKDGGVPLTGYSDQGPFQKPGGRWCDISGWKDLWHNNQGVNRAAGVMVGPGGGTNLTYYGRFDGPSARLRIWYTQ